MNVPAGLHVVVDAANVVGSRPDGWWRDREGAARRLAGQLVAALAQDSDGLAAAVSGVPGGSPLTVHLVLEGRAARVQDLPGHPRLVLVHAPADGDTTIAEVAAGLPGEVLVVTADRELRDRVRAGGAAVVGPGTLLRALPGAGDQPSRSTAPR